MEFIVNEEGYIHERSLHDLAAWYNGDGPDQETFEAHLTMLRATNSLVSSALRGRRGGLTIERYGLLRVLYRSPERRLLMGEIGRKLDVSPTSVTKLVDGLTGLDLVRRISDESDHRRTWVEITHEGARVVEDRLPEVKRYTRERWKGLSSEEKRLLTHLLSKLLISLQPSPVERVLSESRESEDLQLTTR